MHVHASDTRCLTELAMGMIVGIVLAVGKITPRGDNRKKAMSKVDIDVCIIDVGVANQGFTV